MWPSREVAPALCAGDGDRPQQALQTDPCDWSAPTSGPSTGPARNGDQTHVLWAAREDGRMDTGDVDCLPGVQGSSRSPPSSPPLPPTRALCPPHRASPRSCSFVLEQSPSATLLSMPCIHRRSAGTWGSHTTSLEEGAVAASPG